MVRFSYARGQYQFSVRLTFGGLSWNVVIVNRRGTLAAKGQMLIRRNLLLCKRTEFLGDLLGLQST